MAELVVAEEHGQVYDLWRERGERGLRLVHVDFHCDMRGLLVDRRRRRAWRIDASDPRIRIVDSGNFLTHAVAEGIVSSVRWVHDRYAGRRYDVGTVKYESDLTAFPHRILHRLRGSPGVPLEFEEVLFDDWDGVHPGEHLDVDWDAVASVRYDAAKVSRLAGALLERVRARPPESAVLAFSPGYSHPDRSAGEEFAEKLARAIGAEAKPLPPTSGTPARIAPWRRAGEAIERTVVLGLRRIGIY